jgi:hypothetical protein
MAHTPEPPAKDAAVARLRGSRAQSRKGAKQVVLAVVWMVSDMRGGTSSMQPFAALRLCARFRRNSATTKHALRACLAQATMRA